MKRLALMLTLILVLTTSGCMCYECWRIRNELKRELRG